jgi:membrane protease YdiL (CAAX protease family)
MTPQSSIRKILITITATIFVAVLFSEVYRFVQGLLSSPSWVAAAVVNTILAVIIIWQWHKLRLLYKEGIPQSAVMERLQNQPFWYAYIPTFVVLAFVCISGLSTSFSSEATKQPIASHQWYWFLLIPVIEEIVFRAGVGTIFRKMGGFLWGSYFSVILFSLVHSGPTLERVAAFKFGIILGPLILGFFCEILFVMYGRLGPVIALHMVCNGSVIMYSLTDARWLQWLKLVYS